MSCSVFLSSHVKLVQPTVFKEKATVSRWLIFSYCSPEGFYVSVILGIVEKYMWFHLNLNSFKVKHFLCGDFCEDLSIS